MCQLWFIPFFWHQVFSITLSLLWRVVFSRVSWNCYSAIGAAMHPCCSQQHNSWKQRVSLHHAIHILQLELVILADFYLFTFCRPSLCHWGLQAMISILSVRSMRTLVISSNIIMPFTIFFFCFYFVQVSSFLLWCLFAFQSALSVLGP